MLALFREAFTRTRPRVPLDDFHAMTDSFLTRPRMDGVQLREDWTGRNYTDDWVARREKIFRALETGEAPPPLPEDTAVEAARDILDLAASLPTDFKRMRDGLKKMLHTAPGNGGIQPRQGPDHGRNPAKRTKAAQHQRRPNLRGLSQPS